MGIAQADLDFSEARQDFAESSRFLPRFSAESSHAPAPGLSDSPLPPNERYLDPGLRNSWDKFRMFNQLTVSLTQPILTWGQITGSVDAARWGSEVSRAGLREQSLAVARRTSELYFAVLLSSELVRLEEETGLLLERAKNEIGRLLDDGAEGVDDADLFDLLITEQDYKRAVVFADRSYQLAVATLGRQLFVPRGVVVIPAERALNPLDFRLDSMTSYLDDSSLWRPEIEKAIAGVAASESLVRVAKSDYLPKLYLSATARIAATPGRSSQPNPYIRDPLVGRGYIAGIGFTQNLNFARSKAKVRQAEAERDGVLEKQRGVKPGGPI